MNARFFQEQCRAFFNALGRCALAATHAQHRNGYDNVQIGHGVNAATNVKTRTSIVFEYGVNRNNFHALGCLAINGEGACALDRLSFEQGSRDKFDAGGFGYQQVLRCCPAVHGKHAVHIRCGGNNQVRATEIAQHARQVVRAAQVSRKQRDAILAHFIKHNNGGIVFLVLNQGGYRAHGNAGGTNEYQRVIHFEFFAGPFRVAHFFRTKTVGDAGVLAALLQPLR